VAQQRIPAAGRIADTESRDGLGIQAAILQIGARRFSLRRGFELLDEKRLRFPVHFHQSGALLILFAFFRGTLLRAWNRDAALLRDDAHRLGKLALLHLHHETENVSALATAETMENLLHRMD